MISLRPFQDRMINEARALLPTHRRVLVQAPTGAGKTVMASRIVLGALAVGRRAWFTCHRDFLIDQTSKTFTNFGIEHSFIAAGMPFNPNARALICGIDTLKNRLDVIPPQYHPDLILTDEAHHSASAGWRRVIEHYARSRVIGFSATPERLDGKGLDDLFDAMVLGPQIAELIRDGYLSPFRAYCPTTPDTSGLTKRAGDWSKEELADLMDRGAIIGDMIRAYHQFGGGRRGVYFCAGIAHSQHVAAAFCASGIPALHLDGNTPRHERRQAARAFARGDLRILTNVDLFGEGYDLAAQAEMDVSIDLVGLARPTQSTALFYQQCGRAFRMSTGKDYAVILDHASNIIRHGLPDQERQWTLEGRKRKAASEGGGPGVKHCPKCLLATVSTTRKCAGCGHVWVVEERAVEHVDGELEEMSAARLASIRRAEERSAESLADLIDLGRSRGYKNPEGWAAHALQRRMAAGDRRAQQQFDFYMEGRR